MSRKLESIKASKDWREQLRLAQDAAPVTKFDSVFQNAENALLFIERFPRSKTHKNAANLLFAEIGFQFAQWLARRTPEIFFELGDAVKQLKSHRPKPDQIRASLIALNGMFPEGKHRLEIVSGKIIKRERYGKISVRDVVDSLRRHGWTDEIDGDTRKQIRRAAKELNIPLDTNPGRPSIIKDKKRR